MSIASMTGFARAEAVSGNRQWVWELRSVNGRGLDIRCRLPNGYDALDPIVRTAVAERCRRGNVSVNLTENRQQRPRLSINREALGQVLAILSELKDSVGIAAPPRLDGLLALPGVIERVDEEADPASAMELLGRRLNEALDALKTMRLAEGARLVALASAHVDEIERLTEAARRIAATQPGAIAERLRLQLETLLGQSPLPGPDRLAQEAALLAAKADVREELDRLAAHIGAVRSLIQAGGAIGRKFDFLCQEFNREANTLCSKAADVELTRLGLDLKVAIEQLREQVQNIE
ncbi:MAG TPA: YicC/YloC family endoribonuclease [Dongiaceae bacterium]|jgi:uncharacterized protein (TIGR00255 family)|nr:YicC/YloC family endoribonuclease [Dongiaceae bacterium]